jgi:hypothetical protein
MKNKFQYVDNQRPFRIGLHGVFQGGMIWIGIILLFCVLSVGFKLVEKKYSKQTEPTKEQISVKKV